MQDGAHNYIVNARTIDGFGLVEWPAQYGDSVVKTVIVDGVMYQKGLGAQAAKIAGGVSIFDPDSGQAKAN